MASYLERRKFLATLGGAAACAWPLAGRAPAAGDAGDQGLKEAGYFEGEDVAIEHRWAENQLDRLPELAADVTGRRIAA